jgi:hypothetical protein
LSNEWFSCITTTMCFTLLRSPSARALPDPNSEKKSPVTATDARLMSTVSLQKSRGQ